MDHELTKSRQSIRSAFQWLSSDAIEPADGSIHEPIDWVRCIPFILMHLACAGVIVVGVSWTAAAAAGFLYVVRMFCITAFYHRYFSHRAFRTSRALQFVMAAVACSSGQRGPLWWAAHHRHHHAHSDQQADPHSPHIRGFLRSHMGWFMTKSGFATQRDLVRDWDRFSELRWLNRFDWIPLLLLAMVTYVVGVLLAAYAPHLGVDGMQLLVWGFFVSTIVLYHSTYTINSVAHRLGARRFDTGDESRNNAVLAVLTLGEGWHNNHHHYPVAAKQGFYWWELDPTYYVLWLMERLGLVWDLTPVPAEVLSRDRIDDKSPACASKGKP